MATLPRFVFPARHSSFDTNISELSDQPLFQHKTPVSAKEQYSLAVPKRRYSRPANLRALSTPPDSPTRMRAATMGNHGQLRALDNGFVTPPITPTSGTHSKSNSASSDFLSALSSLRRSGSIASKKAPEESSNAPALPQQSQPGSTETIIFPYQLIDYDIQTDVNGRKKLIGEGLWSDVYLAKPSFAKPPPISSSLHGAPDITPPVTPDCANLSHAFLPVVPRLYAVKSPASTSAKKVLATESGILSYLSRFSGAELHMVSFYGLDPRTGTLVLRAMDGTLESWINNLNALDESTRTQHLATVFPKLALSLIDSMIWMHDNGCVHADIKPANILVSYPPPTTTTIATTPPVPTAVFTDFSSSLLSSSETTQSPPPLGAGTWTYLSPTLLTTSTAAQRPTSQTDLWSLSLTLLVTLLGTSPYTVFSGNKYLQREMIRQGKPLVCLRAGDEGERNLRRLEHVGKGVGWDLEAWFEAVLGDGKREAVGTREWKEILVQNMCMGEEKMTD